MVQKWFENSSKMYIKMVLKWTKNELKWILHGLEMVDEWFCDGSEMVYKMGWKWF